MQEALCFDDVLLVPKFSDVSSRQEVSTNVNFLGLDLTFPLISSNMDSVTSPEMAIALDKFGAISCLHRFQSIPQNCFEFEKSSKESINPPLVSIGIGENEIRRALALNESGATRFVIDVAHGAAQHVVDMYDNLRSQLSQDCYIVVGNFATSQSIKEFLKRVKSERKPDAYKVGIGGGSMCTTRVVTGHGLPTFASITDCASLGFDIIADGGIRTSGDIVKALAAGAKMIMIGNLLAGTDEAPGKMIYRVWDHAYGIERDLTEVKWDHQAVKSKHKIYRGSASRESYEVQGKTSSHRSPEGESTLIEYKGPVTPILEQLKAGVKSGMSYCNSRTIQELKENSEFVRVTNNGMVESKAHGVK